MTGKVTALPVVQRRHADGTLCREGTRQLPANHQACCETFEQHTSACVHDVRYEWHEDHQTWVIALSDAAGGGGIAIEYCPHCGTGLRSVGASSGG